MFPLLAFNYSIQFFCPFLDLWRNSANGTASTPNFLGWCDKARGTMLSYTMFDIRTKKDSPSNSPSFWRLSAIFVPFQLTIRVEVRALSTRATIRAWFLLHYSFPKFLCWVCCTDKWSLKIRGKCYIRYSLALTGSFSATNKNTLPLIKSKPLNSEQLPITNNEHFLENCPIFLCITDTFWEKQNKIGLLIKNVMIIIIIII